MHVWNDLTERAVLRLATALTTATRNDNAAYDLARRAVTAALELRHIKDLPAVATRAAIGAQTVKRAWDTLYQVYRAEVRKHLDDGVAPTALVAQGWPKNLVCRVVKTIPRDQRKWATARQEVHREIERRAALGESNPAIAAALGVNPNTVKSIAQRGRKAAADDWSEVWRREDAIRNGEAFRNSPLRPLGVCVVCGGRCINPPVHGRMQRMRAHNAQRLQEEAA